MITGAHAILFSRNADADRAFFRDILKFPHVDVGHGWLIFALPESELAFHPGDEVATDELYLICDDVEAFVRAMKRRGGACSPLETMSWGFLTRLTLPSGRTVPVYQPRHARPASRAPAATRTSTAGAARKTSLKKSSQKRGGAKPARRRTSRTRVRRTPR